LAKVYLDTNVLGHWILLYEEPPDIQAKAEKLAKESLSLLQQIKEDWFNCELLTSKWAIAELAQTLRDNLVAGKILRDGQSLVYFNKLKDYYLLDKEELKDHETYLINFKILLDSLPVQVLPETFDEKQSQLFVTKYGVDTSDAIHLAIANAENAYMVTGDIRLTKLIEDVQEVKIIKPMGLHTIREVRKNLKKP